MHGVKSPSVGGRHIRRPVNGARRLALTFTVLGGTLGSAIVDAQQSPPSVGQLMQQLAPASPPAPPGKNLGVEAPATPPESPQSVSTATVQLEQVRFTGNTHIDDAALRRAVPLIDSMRGKLVKTQQLDAIATAVTHYYRDQGYFVALAYLPHQTVSGGEVIIAVLEGQLGATNVGEHGSYTVERLQSYERASLCSPSSAGCVGAVLTRAKADRAVGLVSALPGVLSASATLAPGAVVGSTNYTLDAVSGPPITGSVGADNYGNEYTGRVRETGNLHWNNPLGIGDLFTGAVALSDRQGLSGTASRGAFNAVFDYSLPVAYDGLRVGGNYTRLMYRLGAPFDVTDAFGSGNAASVYASYPLIVTPTSHLNVRGSVGAAWLTDSVLGYTYHPRDIAATLGVYGDNLDTLGGGAAMQYSATLTRGRVSYGSTPPLGGVHAAPEYAKVNLSVSRDQTLAYLANGTHRISLYGELQGQWADANLDPYDQLSLGGPGGVRGYPVGEASGDQGATATLELRDSFALPTGFGGQNLTASLFRDNGWLTVSHNPWRGYSGARNRNLGSTGIGLDLLAQGRYDLRAMWAIRDPGGEVDRSTHDSRSWLWLQAQVFF